MKITKKLVMQKLEEVIDPEIHISIVDLGLVYETKVSGEKIHIIMTLTTIGCPLFSLIEKEIKDKLKELGFKEENIKLELTFDPPWEVNRLTEKGKAMLGI